MGREAGCTCLQIQVCCLILVSPCSLTVPPDHQRRPCVVNRTQLLLGIPVLCGIEHRASSGAAELFMFWSRLRGFHPSLSHLRRFTWDENMSIMTMWMFPQSSWLRSDVGAGQRGLQSPGGGQDPLGWRQVYSLTALTLEKVGSC